jgi:hypothetical protein
MKYIENIELFLEKNSNKKSNLNLITDLCVSMLLINPNFLDNILDKGQRSRYEHNTNVFLNDLKNLILGKNRLKLGKKGQYKYEEENNIGKVNSYFNEFTTEFNMQKDWKKLSDARDIARNIQDKILLDQKLPESMIRNIFWVAPNKENRVKEDLVLELTDGRQFPLVINSKLNLNKTKSFNTVLDIMLAEQSDNLFTDQYLERWDKLTQEWFKIIYHNCSTDYKLMIDEFIDPTRADSLTYFDYYDITIKNEKYKILGKYFAPLGKNYKELSKLLSDIWKKGKKAIGNFSEIEAEWNEIKKVVLNNKIIEDLIIRSIKKLTEGEEIKRTNDNFILAKNKVKIRLLKLIVELLGIENSHIYYCGKNDYYHIPSKKWFRENYDRLRVEYDYHQKLSEDKDSQFRINVEIDNRPLMQLELYTGFSGGEMSGRLSTKLKLNFENDFNFKVK